MKSLLFKAFIRLYGCDGKKYYMEFEGDYQINVRKRARLYAQKASEYGVYEGGYILIRQITNKALNEFIELEQFVFCVINKDGFYFAHIWKSDLDTTKKMELGEIPVQDKE